MQKEAWANSKSLESHAFGKFKSFIKRQLSRSLSSLWPTVLFVPLANLSQDPPLGEHTPLSQDGFQPRGLWGDLPSFCLPCPIQIQIQFSRSIVSDSSRPHGPQLARLPCPSPTPRACSNSCPSSRWRHPTISSSVCPLLLPSILLRIRVFSNELVLCIRWPKYWSFSFSISPSNEYSGLISFRMDWLDLLAVQGTLKSLL